LAVGDWLYTHPARLWLIFKLAPLPACALLTLAIALILALQAIGYYGIYLITPYDLQWHIDFRLAGLSCSSISRFSFYSSQL